VKRLYNILTKVSVAIVVTCLVPHTYFCLKFFTKTEGQTFSSWSLILTSVILVTGTLALLIFNELKEREILKEILKQFKNNS